MKLKVWCKSVTGSQGKFEKVFDMVKDLGLSDGDWNLMSKIDQTTFVGDVLLEQIEWDYEIIK